MVKHSTINYPYYFTRIATQDTLGRVDRQSTLLQRIGGQGTSAYVHPRDVSEIQLLH